MSSTFNSEIDPGQEMVYQIRIKGQLGRHWADWFEGLAITALDNSETLLTGPVVDQVALHGVLKKVRDGAMPLHAAQSRSTRPGRGVRCQTGNEQPNQSELGGNA